MTLKNLINQYRCHLAFIGIALLLLWHLDYTPYWDPDEARYGVASMEMIHPMNDEPATWIVPKLNTVPRLNKPPLVYWVTASMYQLFGESASSGRLTSALASIGVLAIIWWLAISIWGRERGSKIAVWSMVVWGTSMLTFALSRILNTDMLLTLSTALILASIWRTSEENASPLTYVAAGIGIGLALLSKGPVGVLLPLAIIFIWLIIVHQKYFWKYFQGRTLKILGAFALGFLIGAPWYFAVNQVHPEFLHNFLINENLARFSGSAEHHRPEPLLFYLPVIIVGMMPWFFYIIPALTKWWTLRKEKNIENRGILFLLTWAVFIVAFFSASGTKLITYIEPALPALALLIGFGMSQLYSSKAWKFATTATASLLFLTGTIFIILTQVPAIKVLDKLAPRELLMFPVMATAMWLIITSACGFFLYKQARLRLPILTIAAIGFAVGFIQIIKVIFPYREMSTLVIKLQPEIKPEDNIIQYNLFHPTTMFYIKKPSIFIDYSNRSGLDEQGIEDSKLFYTSKKPIVKYIRDNKRVLIFMKWKHIDSTIKGELKNLHYWGGNSEVALLSNAPPPSGWPIEYFPEGKQKVKEILTDEP